MGKKRHFRHCFMPKISFQNFAFCISPDNNSLQKAKGSLGNSPLTRNPAHPILSQKNLLITSPNQQGGSAEDTIALLGRKTQEALRDDNGREMGGIISGGKTRRTV
jgi:hypothetical protein